MNIVVVGGSGFIGRAVVDAARGSGHQVRIVSAPRLRLAPRSVEHAIALAQTCEERAALETQFTGADVVINAAGIADAGLGANDILLGANAVLPHVLRDAAVAAGATRFVHISSAGVQGRREPLDETTVREPFSPYTRSKAWGEEVLQGCGETVVFRPTSVQGADRQITRSLVGLARSRFASVAGAGDRPTPQVLVEQVGAAICFTATYQGPVPAIVLQPSGGLTTRSLLELLGARRVRGVPVPLARAVTGLLALLGTVTSRATAHARRLQMLWFGQQQSAGWLDRVGWRPTQAPERWREMGDQAASVER